MRQNLRAPFSIYVIVVGVALGAATGCRKAPSETAAPANPSAVSDTGAAVQVTPAPASAAPVSDPVDAPAAAKKPAATRPAEAAAASTVVEAGGAGIQDALTKGRTVVEAYFGEPFAKPFDMNVFPNRAALTEFAKQRWGMEDTQCWMVAMGVSSVLVVLSPDAWKEEACEHESTPEHVREIVTHELVHVFHGQHNPSHEFDGMDDAGWFVEGLAIHVAGQLTDDRMARLRKAIDAGRGPKRLADAWSGPDKYGVCGSLVRFVEQRWGRGKIKQLLPATTNAEILAALGMTEEELLGVWIQSLGEGGTKMDESR